MSIADTNQKSKIPASIVIAICAVAIIIAAFAAWRSMAPRASASALTVAETKA